MLSRWWHDTVERWRFNDAQRTMIDEAMVDPQTNAQLLYKLHWLGWLVRSGDVSPEFGSYVLNVWRTRAG